MKRCNAHSLPPKLPTHQPHPLNHRAVPLPIPLPHLDHSQILLGPAGYHSRGLPCLSCLFNIPGGFITASHIPVATTMIPTPLDKRMLFLLHDHRGACQYLPLYPSQDCIPQERVCKDVWSTTVSHTAACFTRGIAKGHSQVMPCEVEGSHWTTRPEEGLICWVCFATGPGTSSMDSKVETSQSSFRTLLLATQYTPGSVT